MSEYILNNQSFVPASIAAKHAGYTTDYVTRLAREGKIAARKEGKKWMVDLGEMFSFARSAEEEKFRRSRLLSSERKSELSLRDGGETIMTHEVFVITTPDPSLGKVKAFFETALIMCFGLVIGGFWYYAPAIEVPAHNIAGVHEASISLLENTARSLYVFLHPESRMALNGTIDTPVQKHRAYGVILTEGQALGEDVITGAFSDDVRVNFDTEIFDGGVVTPRFESGDGDAYRFKILLEELQAAQGNAAGG